MIVDQINIKITKNAAFLGFFIFAINFIAMKFYLYYSIWWFDMPMHFLGGVFLSFLALWFYRKWHILENSFSSFLFTLLFVAIIGSSWELFEFGMADLFHFNIQPFFDTMSDLSLDLVGGIFGTIYYLKKIMLE